MSLIFPDDFVAVDSNMNRMPVSHSTPRSILRGQPLNFNSAGNCKHYWTNSVMNNVNL